MVEFWTCQGLVKTNCCLAYLCGCCHHRNCLGRCAGWLPLWSVFPICRLIGTDGLRAFRARVTIRLGVIDYLPASPAARATWLCSLVSRLATPPLRVTDPASPNSSWGRRGEPLRPARSPLEADCLIGGNRTVVQAPSGVTASYTFSGGRPMTLTVTAGAEQHAVSNIDFARYGGRTRAEFLPY